MARVNAENPKLAIVAADSRSALSKQVQEMAIKESQSDRKGKGRK